MKRHTQYNWLIVTLFLAGIACSTARAEWLSRTPVQLALWHPVQLFEEDVDVVGVRLGIYGVNNNVTGLDFQLASWTLGNQTGLQIGPYNRVSGRTRGFQVGIANLTGDYFVGWQCGFYNKTAGHFSGLQAGPMNLTLTTMTGLQIGVVNYAQDASGLQIGIFNNAQMLRGIQIGLLNIITDKDTLPILPFVNAMF